MNHVAHKTQVSKFAACLDSAPEPGHMLPYQYAVEDGLPTWTCLGGAPWNRLQMDRDGLFGDVGSLKQGHSVYFTLEQVLLGQADRQLAANFNREVLTHIKLMAGYLSVAAR